MHRLLPLAALVATTIALPVANYGFATEGVNVGVDGAPFDGRPGDNDRIDRTVETVFGSPHADVLTGTQREQRLFGFDGDAAASCSTRCSPTRSRRRSSAADAVRGRYAATRQERCRSG
jgi:hypothetical protein